MENKQISQVQCVEFLTKETWGVLSVFGDDEYPYGMPMNHYYNEEDGCIYFHCGKVGHRLDALRKHNKVSFCVYEQGRREAGAWVLTVRSVIVFGKMDVIDNLDLVIDIATKLSHKFTRDDSYIQEEIRKYAKGTLLLRLTPEHICGKRITES